MLGDEMTNSVYLNRQYNTDIEIIQFGWEKCDASHFFGPAVRDHYLIHYVVDGAGSFQSCGASRRVEAGGGFLICPKQLAYYEADRVAPWEYVWIGFSGVKANELLRKAGLSEKNPVFCDRRAGDCFSSMYDARGKREVETVLLAELYRFFWVLAQNAERGRTDVSSPRQQYVAQAIQYIHTNYVNGVSVNALAGKIGLNRSYFYEIFKAQTGVSPQQYLIAYRLERACRLLLETNLRVSDVARSVGYDDEFMFTRMFTNKMGMSPTKYKKTP
ncbi:MAG: AraC family transcriptional regulator [Clostridiales bacterium]|jgi:AraC-like DNA-binding protein|nr:AraC family transcriptional regulator [Clostridiales bacterium]